MYCWKCGQEIADGAGTCAYCSAKQHRPAPASEAGKAMRQLYDHFGRDVVLSEKHYLVDGLGDLVEDSQKLKARLRMAMEIGAGKMLLSQLNGPGVPDAAFDARFKAFLMDEAGLNDRTAGELAGYFDEMIGWRASVAQRERKVTPAQGLAEEKQSGSMAAPGVEIDRVTGMPYRKPQRRQKLLNAIRTAFEEKDGAVMREEWDDPDKPFDMDAAFKELILDGITCRYFFDVVPDSEARRYGFHLEDSGDRMVCRFNPSGADELLVLLIDGSEVLLDVRPGDAFERPSSSRIVQKHGIFGFGKGAKVVPHTAELYLVGICDKYGNEKTFGEDESEQALMERARRLKSVFICSCLIAIERF